MTARGQTIAKTVLLTLVLAMVLFFTKPWEETVRPVGLGEEVPLFTLPGDDGKLVSLSDFRGKIVVLNFWASWCVPCVDEMPSLRRFAAQYEPKGVQVLAVSWDEDPVAYKEFLKKYQINFLTVRDGSHKSGQRYGTFQLPETYIISRDGHLLNKIIGPTDWNAQQMTSYMDSLVSSSAF